MHLKDHSVEITFQCQLSSPFMNTFRLVLYINLLVLVSLLVILITLDDQLDSTTATQLMN